MRQACTESITTECMSIQIFARRDSDFRSCTRAVTITSQDQTFISQRDRKHSVTYLYICGVIFSFYLHLLTIWFLFVSFTLLPAAILKRSTWNILVHVIIRDGVQLSVNSCKACKEDSHENVQIMEGQYGYGVISELTHKTLKIWCCKSSICLFSFFCLSCPSLSLSPLAFISQANNPTVPNLHMLFPCLSIYFSNPLTSPPLQLTVHH